MRRLTTVLTFLLAVLSTARIAAQAPETPVTVAPGEPEILLPQVILSVEDLSVERVEAKLPAEAELLPPARPLPTLKVGDLAIPEPGIAAAAPEAEGSAAAPKVGTVTSEVLLGAGIQNQIRGSVSLKTLGEGPPFSLTFNHETMNGFSGQATGSGYSLRNDGLDGELKLNLGGAGLDLAGSFQEAENGLQGKSPYLADLNRSLSSTATLSGSPLTWLDLSATVQGSSDSLTLETGDPTAPSPQLSGFLLSPALQAQAHFGPVKLGVQAQYSWRSDPPDVGGQLNRFNASASLSANLPQSFIVSASGGWAWNSAGLSAVPFELRLTGTPLDFLSFGLGGGYRVTPYDLHEQLAASPYALPAGLSDDSGWFGDVSTQFTLTRELATTLMYSVQQSNAMPVGSATADAATGLLPISQRPGIRMSTDLGLRWGITKAFSLSADWVYDWMDRPFFVPQYSVSLELIGLEGTGRFGGSLSMSLAPPPDGVLQLPVLRATAFWKISDAVTLQLDGTDLLWSLLAGPRWDLPPYVTPGMRITGLLKISL